MNFPILNIAVAPEVTQMTRKVQTGNSATAILIDGKLTPQNTVITPIKAKAK
jgi:hypothetical protein